jgi:hypothetical protein
MHPRAHERVPPWVVNCPTPLTRVLKCEICGRAFTVWHDGKLKQLNREIESLQQRSEQLLEAVERGLLPMDETLTMGQTKSGSAAGSTGRIAPGASTIKQMERMPWREEDAGVYCGIARTTN